MVDFLYVVLGPSDTIRQTSSFGSCIVVREQVLKVEVKGAKIPALVRKTNQKTERETNRKYEPRLDEPSVDRSNRSSDPNFRRYSVD
jgi:hypothetical protein